MNWGRHNRDSTETAIKRFLSKTDRLESGCWAWNGAIGSHKRYGIVGLMGKKMLAHRAAWLLFKESDPGAMFVCHHCDNGLCVNPDHLFLGTQSDNVADMESKGRANHPTGEKHGRAKLTQAQADTIRQAWPAKSHNELAREYGVARPTIARIIKCKGWITT